MTGRATMTNQGGAYAFNGVSGVLQVRGSKVGYVTATQNVSGDTEHVNIGLTPSVPYASVGGTYRLTFKASSSCQLPADAVSRTYTAGIDQRSPGATLTVTLSDAQFRTSGNLTWNMFFGRVFGNAVTFTLNDSYYCFYYGGCVLEQLAENRYLSLVGTAQATATASAISAVFAGTVSVTPSSFSAPIATCSASDHQLLFTRTAAATSRQTF